MDLWLALSNREFQIRQDYIVKPYLKTNQTKQKGLAGLEKTAQQFRSLAALLEDLVLTSVGTWCMHMVQSHTCRKNTQTHKNCKIP